MRSVVYPGRVGREADELLTTSTEFAAAQQAFDQAIRNARRAGWPDEEIARVIGLSTPMVERVAGRRDPG